MKLDAENNDQGNVDEENEEEDSSSTDSGENIQKKRNVARLKVLQPKKQNRNNPIKPTDVNILFVNSDVMIYFQNSF